MFSIVIPLYNKEQRVKNTIQSILNQSIQDFEILVVNDGSTDRSAEIVAGIKDPRIHLIQQENSGVSAARNKGIKSANYDWIAFLDADDYWEISFLEEISLAIKNYPDNKIFVGGTSSYLNSQFHRYANKFLPKDGNTDLVNFFTVIKTNDSPINSSNVVIKKIVFYNNGFFIERQKNYEDYNLWIRLCVKESIVYINKQLSVYVKDDFSGASKSGYSAKDFLTMANTFLETNGKLSAKDLDNFKEFYRRHCVIVSLRYYPKYNKAEKRSVLKAFSKILTGLDLFKVKLICLLHLSQPIIYAKKMKAKHSKR